MIVVTGDCLSSGHEMLDKELWGDEYQTKIQTARSNGETDLEERVQKAYDVYLRQDPKFERINRKDSWVRNAFAQIKIEELEHLHSWPVHLGKRLNRDVVNLAQTGSNFKREMDKFERFMHTNKMKVTHVIHQIPGHWRTTIKADKVGHFRPKHIGPNIVTRDTTWHNIRNLFQKPSGERYILEEYKKILRQPEFFNDTIRNCLALNRHLEQKYQYKTFYILTQSITKKCLVNNEQVLHDNLKSFAWEKFESGTDCPITMDYVDYMIDLVGPVID